MELYQSLGVDCSASKDDIKKAYKILAKQYHPDKNNDPNATDKFIEIKKTYDILMEQDSMKNDDMFTYIKTYISKHAPFILILYDIILKMYNIDETYIKTNFNKDKKIDLNIHRTVYCSLEDKYMNRFRKISIKRPFDKEPTDFFIPLSEPEIRIEKYGEKHTKNNSIGDLIINIVCEHNENYQIINDYDIIVNVYVTEQQFVKGSSIIFDYFDEEITFIFPSCLNREPLFCVENKGIPINCDENNRVTERGNLFILIKR